MLKTMHHHNFIHLEKDSEKGLVTLMITELPEGLLKLSYIGEGMTRVIKTPKLIASRVVSSLLGADYQEVHSILRGVA